MKFRAALSLSALSLIALLAACVTPPAPQAERGLFADARFEAPAEAVRAEDVFALSPAMKAYLDGEIADKLRSKGRLQGLVDALYKKGELRLEYDSVTTRNASQAFAARSGNCLSLVIMTAAFAKELGLAVRYQSVVTDETWGRAGDMVLLIDHINLSLARRLSDIPRVTHYEDRLTIDFLPPQDLRGQREQVLSEATVVAMFMNNRAAESLARGRVNDAYWWAREAIVQDPAFARAYNTLGVVYRRHGDLADAERALRHALARQPSNTQAMSNLALVLADLGRDDEASELNRRLAQLQPEPPFSYFNRGQAALRDGDLQRAREMFQREVDRAPYSPEFHYWLAVTYGKLGESHWRAST